MTRELSKGYLKLSYYPHMRVETKEN